MAWVYETEESPEPMWVEDPTPYQGPGPGASAGPLVGSEVGPELWGMGVVGAGGTDLGLLPAEKEIGFPQLLTAGQAVVKATPALIPALGPAAAAVGTALGVIGAGYSIYQGLGGGEGGGLFGLNILGGDTQVIDGVVLSGPGVPEPSPSITLKHWKANGCHFYHLTNGKIAVYNPRNRRWKVYRPPKLAVIGKNMPSHQMITRLRRHLKRQRADATTIMNLTGGFPGFRKVYGKKRGR